MIREGSSEPKRTRSMPAILSTRQSISARENMPDVCFTTDVIVGFPQETEADFQETMDFVGKAGFLMVHIFPYSSRKGTEAAKMKGQIDKSEKTRRLHELEKIAKESRLQILSNQINNTPIKTVLFETFDGEFLYGHTDNFIEVAVKCSEDLRSLIKTVKLTHTDGNICFGEIID